MVDDGTAAADAATADRTEGTAQREVASESDDRTVNNAVRHAYRVLTEEEKALMLKVKDLGAEFLSIVEGIGSSRELSIAKTKLEEAVMWAVKHITA